MHFNLTEEAHLYVLGNVALNIVCKLSAQTFQSCKIVVHWIGKVHQIIKIHRVVSDFSKSDIEFDRTT